MTGKLLARAYTACSTGLPGPQPWPGGPSFTDIITSMETDLDKKIFMLIDGSAILHRAYHAMPSFMSTNGVATGAVYGFFSMLLKLMHNLRPEYIAVAFDRGKPTFRQLMYVGYHANRPHASQDLKDQFGMVREVLDKVAIPVYELDGFEGDDLIGTINKKINDTQKDIFVYIVTGDRDMLQLVDEDTYVLMPVKGISEVMIYDSKRVIEKFGVRPDQIVDLKGFMGDSSDNYPGVPGVGPKTAMNLLQKYEHFENVFRNIAEIEKENPKLAAKLALGSDQATMAQALATIKDDVPFVFSLKDCEKKNFTKEKFQKVFTEYSFNSLAKRLDEVFGKDKPKGQMKLL